MSDHPICYGCSKYTLYGLFGQIQHSCRTLIPDFAKICMKVTTETLNEFIDSKIWWPKECGRKMDDKEVEVMQKEIVKFPECSMLQVGTNYGWTAFNVLKQLNQVVGHLDTIDFHKARKPKLQKRTDLWVKHFGRVVKKYELDWLVSYYIKGSSNFFKNQGKDKKYHVIFLDGDHRYKQAYEDLNNAVERIHQGGTIFVHDIRESKYLGKKSGAKVFNRFEDPRFTKYVLPTKFKLGVLKYV